MTPSVDLGLRHDRGDAETGTGVEIGADLGYMDTSRGLDAEVGYGMAVFGGGFTGTLNVEFGLSDTAREFRMGWRLSQARTDSGSFEVNLDAIRREAGNDSGAEHGVMLRSLLRW